MGRKAEQAQATREHLIRAATALFAERGYDDTTVGGVLARAGVSKGALYHHFPNKEALFEAVFEENERLVADRIAEVALQQVDPVDVLRAGALAWLDMVMDPHVRRISLVDGPAVLGWQRWREIDEKYGFGLVKTVLQAGIDAGRIRNQQVDMLAHVLLAALGEAAMVIARSEDPAAAREAAAQAIDRLFAGLIIEGDT